MSDRAVASLERLTSLARFWDDWLRVPVLGWRIGLDALVGLVPGVGDLIGTVVGCYALLLAVRAGAGVPILGPMLLNLAIDAGIGAVPLVGDLLDMGWRANRRNRALLERWIGDPARTKRASAIGLGLVGAGMVGLVAASVWLLIAAVRWLLTWL